MSETRVRFSMNLLGRTMIRIAIAAITLSALSAGLLANTQAAQAWPSFASSYEKARDSSGKIACANCHLGVQPVEVEVPTSVMANEVFEVKLHIPYDSKVQQVQGDGTKGPMQIGAYVQLPEGFTLAEEKDLNEEQRKVLETQPVSPLYADKPERSNILISGPYPGDTVKDQEIIIPVKAPDPNAKGATVNFGKYSIYAAGNRGRGQVYTNGTASNNAQYTASAAGTITKIEPGIKYTAKLQYGGDSEALDQEYENATRVTIQGDAGKSAVVNIPPGPQLLADIKEGVKVKAGQPLTNDPNVGGYAQEERDIVLQDPQRVTWLLVFLAAAFVCQLLLVLKKKQVEKVQELEAQQQGL